MNINNYCQTLWTWMQRHPYISLAIILGLQTAFTLTTRNLWYSDEIRYANVFEHLINAKKWLVLYLNGQPYPDKPPLYFWFIYLVKVCTPLTPPALFLFCTTISAYIYLIATYHLGLITIKDQNISFLSCVVLLTNLYFMGVTHYFRMDLFFASLIIFSHIYFYKYYLIQKNKYLHIAFILSALAVLTKGPLGLAFPLISFFIFLTLQKKLNLIWQKEFLKSFSLCITLLLLWVIGAYIVEGEKFLHNIFYDQIYRRAVNTWHHPQPFYHYLLTLPLAWLPWTIVLLVQCSRFNVQRFFKLNCSTGLSDTQNGLKFLLIYFFAGFILLSCISIKIVIYLLPIFAPLAILTASIIQKLLPVIQQHETPEVESKNSESGVSGVSGERGVSVGLAFFFALLAITLPFANFFHPWPIKIKGHFLAALVCLGLAIILFKLRKKDFCQTLMTMLVGITLLINILGIFTAPSLDAVMSPRAQAEKMAGYIQKGYTPVAYKIYSGTYTYYAGQNILETRDLAMIGQKVKSGEKIVLAIRKKDWDRWRERPENLKIVNKQWIVDGIYYLVVTPQSTT